LRLLRHGATKAWSWLGPFLGLALICVFFATYPASSERFMSWDNWRLIGAQSVILGTAALGMTLVMIAGGIDLSVGSAVALVTVVVAQAIRAWALPVPAALALGVGIGFLCGFFNGLLITTLRVVPFIITLGTLKIYRGLAKFWAGNLTIDAFSMQNPAPAWLRRLLSYNLEPPAWLGRDTGNPLLAALREISRLAPGVWLLLVLALAVALLLRYGVFGRYLYAVGSNEATARLCGIRVNLVRLYVYALAGLAVGLAGGMQFAYSHGTGEPTSAEGLELKVIAAVVIGGGSLSGGEGTVLGTLIGCLIVQVLDSGCTMALIPNAIQDILIGAIIVIAVALDRLRRDPAALRSTLERLMGKLRPAR
jgi:ribose/xylose/arabinose/galactoside ABC-type transport system permease subunit